MKTKNLLIIIGAGALTAWYLKKKAIEIVGQVVDAVNPVSTENIFYKGAAELTGVFTGSNEPLGLQIYDWMN